MNKSFSKFIALILLLIIISCKDEINNPVNPTEKLFKIEGYVTFDCSPILNLEIVLDTNKCYTDSSGYFSFDSLGSGSSELKINHPQFIPVDTILNINSDISISFELQYRSNSFFPLKIGNKWFYDNLMAQRPDSTEKELVIEVMDVEKKGDKYFYKLLFTDTSSDLIDTLRYYRYMSIIGDSLYEYACNETELLAIFDIPIGTIFQIRRCIFNYDATLYEKSDLVLKYFYRAIGAFDADFYFIFQKGIGITQYSTAWSNFLLDRYEINY